MTYKELYDYIQKNITDEALKTTLINKLIQIEAGLSNGGIEQNSGNSLEDLSKLTELYDEVAQAELLQYKRNNQSYYDYLNSFIEKKTDSNTGKTKNKKFFSIIAIVVLLLVLGCNNSCVSYTKITQEQQQEQIKA